MTEDRRDARSDRRTTDQAPPGGVERRRSESDRRTGRPAPPPRRDELTGGGRTGLSVDAALRARDVDRPTAADLARAEAELTIVRRHWTPPAG